MSRRSRDSDAESSGQEESDREEDEEDQEESEDDGEGPTDTRDDDGTDDVTHEDESAPKPLMWQDEGESETDSDDEAAREDDEDDQDDVEDEQDQDYVDPLGIKDEDTVRARITEAKDPKEALLITNETFNPALYLSRVHYDTSYDQLIEGTLKLDEVVNKQELRLKDLVKAHFDKFISCKDTIDSIYALIQSQELSKETSGTQKLKQIYQGLTDRAEAVFGHLLERNKQADRNRHLLAWLEKYKFIFSLPANIKAAISKGEHDKVVHEYRRAVTVLSDTNVGIFRKVFGEVQALIDDFRRQLHQVLSNPFDPSPAAGRGFKNCEKVIRLLLELGGTDDDPAWKYVTVQHKALLAMLDASVDSPLASGGLVVTSSGGSGHSSPTASPPMSPLSPKRSGSRTADAEGTAGPVDTVKRLSALLEVYLPDFWKLCVWLLSGEAAKPSAAGAAAAVQRTEADFEPLVREVFEHYGQNIRGMFGIKGAEKDVAPLGGGLSEVYSKDAVRVVLKTYDAVRALGMPDAFVRPMAALVKDVTESFITEKWRIAIDTASQLHTREDLVTGAVDSSVLATVPTLPDEFASLVKSTLKEIDGLVDTTSPSAVEIVAKVRKWLVKALNAFAGCFHQLAFVDGPQTGADGAAATGLVPTSGPSGIVSGGAVSLLGLEPANFDDDELEPLEDNPRRQRDRRLLVVLAHCARTVTDVIPSLFEMFAQQFSGVSLAEERRRATELFEAISQRLLNKYVRRKTLLFRRRVKRGLLLSGIDWLTQPEPTAVKEYIMDILLQLVFIHSEIVATAEQFMDPILSKLVENIVEAFYGCIQTVERFGFHGISQLELDLEFFTVIMGNYTTDAFNVLYDACYELLGALKSRYEQEEKPKEPLNKPDFKPILVEAMAMTQIMFKCFQKAA